MFLIVLKVQALDQELIERIRSSVLCISNGDGVIATAIVWDFTDTDVRLLTNYHTWDSSEFRYCFPPPSPPPPTKKRQSKKRKTRDDEEEGEEEPVELHLRNDLGFVFSFHLTADLFHSFEKAEDFAVLQLPKSTFTMQRIPICIELPLNLKIHAFGYIGHTQQFNIAGGEVSGFITEGFTMNLLSAGGFSGAAIIADGYGRAVGYMGGNLDDKNSQHQSYGYRLDRVMIVTGRSLSPTSSPAGKGKINE